MTDTGSFRFENATEQAFQLAAELMRFGIKPTEIYRQVYESYSRQRMTLLGSILQRIHYECDGRLAWFTVTLEDRQGVGVELDEIGGFTDFIRSIKGVEVAVMFLEINTHRVRVNFRSNGRVVINTIARKFGGGGHYFAAGLTLDQTIQTATDLVVPAVRQTVENIDW
jgi:phosphoesterase RecJ-like protein